jgi:hypothetical protein
VKPKSQKAWPWLICSFMVALWTAAAAELRTWKFSQDGQMKTSSGGVASFKKNGRLDAVFIRCETNNVLLLASRGEYLTIGVTNLSDQDRDFIARSVRLNEPEGGSIAQTAIERNEISRRKLEAAKVREDAAEKRRKAETELDEADKIDSEAGALSLRAGALKSEAAQAATPDGASDGTNPSGDSKAAHVTTKSASIARSAAEQLDHDVARMQLQAKGKREKAADFQKQAAQLEQTAGLLETNAAPGTPVCR